MPAKQRMRLQSDKHSKNIVSRGNVPKSLEPIQPDDDDLPPPDDDALVTPTSSTSAGISERKQPSKNPQGLSDLASVLKEVLAADCAREDDVRKSVQDLGKPPDARQAWAAWFASVCQDVPDERFREFQQEMFTVSMRYLMAPTQQQVQHQPMWQQAPMTQVIQPMWQQTPMTQVIQPMWQQTPRPQQHWQTSPQIPQQHIQPFPQQSLSYTPTQDVQSYSATSITTGEMGTSSSNLGSKSAPPTSNILHQAFDATLGPAAGSLTPILTSQSPQPSLLASSQSQTAQQSTATGSVLSFTSELQD